MSDSASGSIAGFLFQFEKALVLLATLENSSDLVSIELIDDVAIQGEDDVVLMAVQSKHSISPNGTTFEDTSNSLWRTLQLWIQKLEKGIFNSDTEFVCSTNKTISDRSLLRRIQDKSFDDVICDIKTLLKSQKDKLKKMVDEDPKAGSSVKKIIKLMEYVISKPDEFRIIKENIVIRDNESLLERFFVAVHMSSEEYSSVRKMATFEAMYGWIVNSSKAKWLQSPTNGAVFSKKDFDTKFAIINSNPAIINAVFRKKSDLGTIDPNKLIETKKELFVTQISDIKRNQSAKERSIEKAVLDFIYHDIEMTHIIASGNFTEPDFIEFKNSCREKWQDCHDSIVINELEDYDEKSKNDMAIKIFDSIMNNIEVCFQEGMSFNPSNRYIHNGTFLKLSNVPEIGWHPDWETKYKNND